MRCVVRLARPPKGWAQAGYRSSGAPTGDIPGHNHWSIENWRLRDHASPPAYQLDCPLCGVEWTTAFTEFTEEKKARDQFNKERLAHEAVGMARWRAENPDSVLADHQIPTDAYRYTGIMWMWDGCSIATMRRFPERLFEPDHLRWFNGVRGWPSEQRLDWYMSEHWIAWQRERESTAA